MHPPAPALVPAPPSKPSRQRRRRPSNPVLSSRLDPTSRLRLGFPNFYVLAFLVLLLALISQVYSGRLSNPLPKMSSSLLSLDRDSHTNEDEPRHREDQDSQNHNNAHAHAHIHAHAHADADAEDASTIHRKFMVGYQGWFTCSGDGPPINPAEPDHHGWKHWVDAPLNEGGRVTFELWPSLREYEEDELFEVEGLSISIGEEPAGGEGGRGSGTGRQGDGEEKDEDEGKGKERAMVGERTRPAKLFSSRNEKTVRRHFKWMKEFEISGAFLQRFLGEVRDGLTPFRDEVAEKVRKSAEAEGRVWSIMYDVSGIKGAGVEPVLKKDWEHIINDTSFLQSSAYLHDQGRPVIAIWGMGMSQEQHDVASLVRLIKWIKDVTPGGAYVFAGTPSHWRTRDGDCDTDPEFEEVWKVVDGISPWYVGRFGNEEDADHFRDRMRDDIALIKREDQDWTHGQITDEGNKSREDDNEAKKEQEHEEESAEDTVLHHRDYAPVVFPGFSWQNLHSGPFNEIPRAGGRFLWHQIFNAQSLGVNILYGAMFDEYDEATAIMPSESLHTNTPREVPFMALDADGEVLPDDWYLRVCALGARALKTGERVNKTFPREELEAYIRRGSE